MYSQTKNSNMKTYPCILTIAGSDCSGGAGIQADIKTISALGAYAASAITAITVQNTCGVSSIFPIPAQTVKAQIEAVMTDIRPEAVKIGMVSDPKIVAAIAQSIRRFQPRYVVFDPVMVSTSGCKLMEDSAIEAIVRELMPLSTLITPNLSEAEVLTNTKLSSPDEMEEAAGQLLQTGCGAVLIKGGHLPDDKMCDVLKIADEEQAHRFTAPKIESKNTHGTGCTLSSAIATFLALGHPLAEAAGKAKEYIYKGIEAGKDIHIGEGHGPLNHFFNPAKMHILDKNV